jgi:hypothetical protein
LQRGCPQAGLLLGDDLEAAFLTEIKRGSDGAMDAIADPGTKLPLFSLRQRDMNQHNSSFPSGRGSGAFDQTGIVAGGYTSTRWSR